MQSWRRLRSGEVFCSVASGGRSSILIAPWIPHIDQNLGLVEDVLPTTDFQDLAIKDALCEWSSRWPHFILICLVTQT